MRVTAQRLIVTVTALAIGYVAGVNATVVTSALYVSRVTRTSFYQVLDPLHRPWIRNAIEASTVPPVVDDEQIARDVESIEG